MILDSDLDNATTPCNCTFQNCYFSANKEFPVGGGMYYCSKRNTICSLNFIETNFVSNAVTEERCTLSPICPPM